MFHDVFHFLRWIMFCRILCSIPVVRLFFFLLFSLSFIAFFFFFFFGGFVFLVRVFLFLFQLFQLFGNFSHDKWVGSDGFHGVLLSLTDLKERILVQFAPVIVRG